MNTLHFGQWKSDRFVCACVCAQSERPTDRDWEIGADQKEDSVCFLLFHAFHLWLFRILNHTNQKLTSRDFIKYAFNIYIYSLIPSRPNYMHRLMNHCFYSIYSCCCCCCCVVNRVRRELWSEWKCIGSHQPTELQRHSQKSLVFERPYNEQTLWTILINNFRDCK